MSSPGRMFDIEGTSFCAGIPPLSSGGVQRPSMTSGGGSGGIPIAPMSSGGDLGRVPSPPGLPLSDPPRMTGAYGVPAYDPDFGFAFRGSAFDNQSSAPPPPPPAGSAGVKDPYVHLLESQSAMSMLVMQMARSSYASARMEILDFERKRTVRFQGLVGEVQWLVESYP